MTWAKRSTRARILLQSDITRDAMNIQLAEATGKQSRATVTDVASRQQTPAHLRVWVSSTVRHALAIPPTQLFEYDGVSPTTLPAPLRLRLFRLPA